MIFILLGLANVANIWTSLWLSYWTSDKYPNFSTGQYIGVYAGLGASVVLLMFVFSTYMTTCGTNASRTMLQRAMTRVLRAPMSFFDTTPLGRITNRFSKDIQVMDNELSDAMRIYALTMTMIISVMVLIIVFFYYVSDTPRLRFYLTCVLTNSSLSLRLFHCSSCSCLRPTTTGPPHVR
jgi:ABC-type multidrug transport system fused ATPase/permease subunit